MSESTAQAPEQPAPGPEQAVPTLLRVDHGSPTAEEVAALTMVLAALAAAAEPERPRRQRPGWGAPRRAVGQQRMSRPSWGNWDDW